MAFDAVSACGAFGALKRSLNRVIVARVSRCRKRALTSTRSESSEVLALASGPPARRNFLARRQACEPRPCSVLRTVLHARPLSAHGYSLLSQTTKGQRGLIVCMRFFKSVTRDTNNHVEERCANITRLCPSSDTLASASICRRRRMHPQDKASVLSLSVVMAKK